MKKFKKLIPAFCAMLVSAAMLGTSTYAWFSVNKEVTATGMSVKATVNTEYFVISSDPSVIDGSTFKAPAGNPISVEYTESETVLRPVAWTTEAIKKNPSDESNTVGANNWYTGNVKLYDDENQTNWATLEQLGNSATALVKTDYFKAFTFYIGLAKTSADYEGTFTFTPVKPAGLHGGIEIAAVKVEGKKGSTLDANDQTLEIFKASSKTTSTSDKYVLKADGTAYVKVTVYVCIDGTNEQVKDSEATKIKGSIGIKVTGESTGA